ncbi:MAG: sigma-54-dependent Fis family transcriptional regulator [Deltaproteobacteria bacterium]|nr:sigma-54-dependent Fis family transcriptional regulator [Deltaproteobacteria bacterium]
MRKVLIVDDDTAVTNHFLVFLVQTGMYDPLVSNDSREVEGLLERGKFDVVMLDMDMPDVSGMDILRVLRAKGDDTPVVVITGVSDVDLAVRAMKLGAFDYLTKPVDGEALLQVLENAIQHRTLRREIEDLPNRLTRKELAHEAAFQQLQTQDDRMIRLFHQAEKLAASDVSIFMCGERGTGKKALARAIHQASPRKEQQFIAIEAGRQDPERFPVVFFGQVKEWGGLREETAGILDRADHGTIFIGCIEKISLPMQVKLKRLILGGEYYRENSTTIRNADVRVIATSEHDLTRPEYAGKFSRDLLYHLMTHTLRIPPLRERPGDIPLLARRFLKEAAGLAGKEIGGFTEDSMGILRRHAYPGNVKELEKIVSEAVAKEKAGSVTVESLPGYLT